MAGLCLGAYDCTLTVDEERRHIWMQPWSVTKVMYIFNRYGMICVSLYFIMSKYDRGLSDSSWLANCVVTQSSSH